MDYYLELLKLRKKLSHRFVPFSLVDDKFYLQYWYYKVMNRRLHLKHPKTFTEKMQWLKLYDRNPLYTKLADKLAVREYVEQKVGKEYLNPLIGVYNRVDEIEWQSLPNKFVVKVNHGSSWNLICENKDELDIDDASNKIRQWMSMNFYNSMQTREWQYRDIPPQILIEDFIEGHPIFGLLDYKVLCFSGQAKYIQVHANRATDHSKIAFNTQWELLPLLNSYSPMPWSVPKPKKLDEMLTLAEELSAGIPFARVDFYYPNEKVIFGEITFFPQGGFRKDFPYEKDLMMGNLIKLPMEKGFKNCR